MKNETRAAKVRKSAKTCKERSDKGIKHVFTQPVAYRRYLQKLNALGVKSTLNGLEAFKAIQRANCSHCGAVGECLPDLKGNPICPECETVGKAVGNIQEYAMRVLEWSKRAETTDGYEETVIEYD
jgi:hypothetical protein